MPLKVGPSSARQWPTVDCWLGSFVFFITRKPYIFVCVFFFMTPSLPLWIRPCFAPVFGLLSKVKTRLIFIHWFIKAKQ